MTEQQMIEWIDNADYHALLHKWRSADAGSPFFTGAVGLHFIKVMGERRPKDDDERAAISKAIGWEE